MARQIYQPGTTGTAPQAGAGGLSPLQMILGGAAAKKGQFGTAYGILKPEEPKEPEAAEIFRKTAEETITEMQADPLTRVGSFDAFKIKSLLALPFDLGRPMIGERDQDLLNLHSNFELLKQSAVTYLQGKRASDMDIRMAAQYTPSIMDTKATIKTKLKNLKRLVRKYQ